MSKIASNKSDHHYTLEKKYKIKEIYYTLQGEGYHSGRPAVFCRFTGCNLWSGKEEDRHKAICKFCDTDFWGIDGENGGKYTAKALAELIDRLWTANQSKHKFVVFTGGEPMLQLDEHLVECMHLHEFEVAVETNGTLDVPAAIDWICVSPKAGTEIITKSGQELKLVYPQNGMSPSSFQDWEFEHHYLQPMDDSNLKQNTSACIDYCKMEPKWKLSIQSHKLLNIP